MSPKIYVLSSKIFKTKGETNINTTENYLIEGKDIILDDKNKNIKSDKSAIITDIDNNLFYLSNFEYLSNTNILRIKLRS